MVPARVAASRRSSATTVREARAGAAMQPFHAVSPKISCRSWRRTQLTDARLADDGAGRGHEGPCGSEEPRLRRRRMRGERPARRLVLALALQVREDPFDQRRLLDARDDLELPAAAPAGLDLAREHALQPLRPAHRDVLRHGLLGTGGVPRAAAGRRDRGTQRMMPARFAA